MLHYTHMDTEIGVLTIVEDEGYITRIIFGREMPEGVFFETETLIMAKAQLREYFEGERMSFTLPVMLYGTDFQKKVWRALVDVPYGKRATYKDIAEKIGSPKAFRAVGMANNKNPVPIIVPCHRIVGSDGSLTGYAGGIDMKRFLLTLEEENI